MKRLKCSVATLLLLCWAGLSVAEDLQQGLVGEYFQLEPIPAEPDWPGLPAGTPLQPDLIRLDRQIDYDAGGENFAGTDFADHFFVRWSGILRVPKAGAYRLWLSSDDGSRLYLNDELIIDNWGAHSETRVEKELGLEEKDYRIRIEFYDITSNASCHFGWDPPEGVPSGIIPEANLLHVPQMLKNARNRVEYAKRMNRAPLATVTDSDGHPRFGYIFLENGNILIGESSGNKVAVEPDKISKIEFNNPAWTEPKGEDKPPIPQHGPLAAPWKHAVVGRLVSGSSAHGNGSSLELFTSAKHPSEKFSSFAMAYIPAPVTGHFTARVTKIENQTYGAYAGIVYRDGVPVDRRNAMLTIRPTGGVTMRFWKNQGGNARSDSRGEIRPPYWVRILRDGETVAGMTSPDGRAWRKIWEVPDKFEGDEPIFGVVAGAREGGGPWAAGFDNISVGSLEDAEVKSNTKPRIYLTDGSVVKGAVTSSETGKLIHLGKPWNKTIPALYVARVDFFHPVSAEIEERLAEMRPGVLLTGGDFLEASFENLDGELLKVTSALFGEREYRPSITVDSLVLRPAEGGRRAELRVETWDDQVFFARGFSVGDGKFVFDGPFIGNPAFGPEEIRRIVSAEDE